MFDRRLDINKSRNPLNPVASAHPLTKPLKVERETLVYAVHDIVQPFPYWFGPRCLIPKRPRYYILHNETKTFKEFDFDYENIFFHKE